MLQVRLRRGGINLDRPARPLQVSSALYKSPLFTQSKPNLQNHKTSATSYGTQSYTNITLRSAPKKQTQSNPIYHGEAHAASPPRRGEAGLVASRKIKPSNKSILQCDIIHSLLAGCLVRPSLVFCSRGRAFARTRPCCRPCRPKGRYGWVRTSGPAGNRRLCLRRASR